MENKFKYQRSSEISSSKGNLYYEFIGWESVEVLERLFSMHIVNNTENMMQNDGTNFSHKIVVSQFANLTDMIDFSERHTNASIHFSIIRNVLEVESVLDAIEKKNKQNSSLSIINRNVKENGVNCIAMITYNG